MVPSVPSPNHPLTSMMKSMSPAALYTQTSWRGPSAEMIRFGSAEPAGGFRFDAAGAPVGHASVVKFGVATVTYVAIVALTAVMLKTAAAAPVVGIAGPWAPDGSPESTTSRHVFAGNGWSNLPAHSVPLSARVSQILSAGML